jgi:hypothetical protein
LHFFSLGITCTEGRIEPDRHTLHLVTGSRVFGGANLKSQLLKDFVMKMLSTLAAALLLGLVIMRWAA